MRPAITSSSRGRSARWRCSVPAMIASLLLAGATSAGASAINNLEQLGIGLHNAGNDLSQLGLALHAGSYAAADGSVRTVIGDGSVRFISIGSTASSVLCVHNATTTGQFLDGTSNTLLFSESLGLRFTGGTLLGSEPIRGIADGTSNTIIFPESPLSNFCIDDVTNLDPVTGPNITDGTSNTIQLPETRNNVCFENVVAAPDLTVVSTVSAVPEPATLALAVVPVALAMRWHRRNRSAVRRA